jgi:hypothetical protein
MQVTFFFWANRCNTNPDSFALVASRGWLRAQCKAQTT